MRIPTIGENWASCGIRDGNKIFCRIRDLPLVSCGIWDLYLFPHQGPLSCSQAKSHLRFKLKVIHTPSALKNVNKLLIGDFSPPKIIFGKCGKIIFSVMGSRRNGCRCYGKSIFKTFEYPTIENSNTTFEALFWCQKEYHLKLLEDEDHTYEYVADPRHVVNLGIILIQSKVSDSLQWKLIWIDQTSIGPLSTWIMGGQNGIWSDKYWFVDHHNRHLNFVINNSGS